MVLKRFCVVADGNVFDVGLRLALIKHGVDYGLKVAARNLLKEDKVEVIVKGKDEDIKSFWNAIKEEDIRLLDGGGKYSVSDLEDYLGPEPDWSYRTSAFMAEEFYEGTKHLKGIDQKLGALDRIQDALDKLPERIAKALKEAF